MNYEKKDQRLCHFSTAPKISASLRTIITNPQTWYIAIYACLLWAPMSGFASLWGVPFLISADNLSADSAAFYCSFMWLGLALASPVLGIFSSLINNKWMPLVLSALIGIVSFGFVLGMQLSGPTLALMLFFAGAACSGQALSFAVVRDNNSDAIKGSAIAFNNMAVVISGAIMQPLIGHLISGEKIDTLKNYTLIDYKRGLIVVLIAYVVSAVVALFFIRERKNEQ
jgi:hypothetical protein